MKTTELIKLVKEVFSHEPGSILLKELEAEILSPNMFDENTNKVYWRVGQVDLISRLKSMVDMPAIDVEQMEKAEKDVEDFDSNKPTYNEFGDLII